MRVIRLFLFCIVIVAGASAAAYYWATQPIELAKPVEYTINPGSSMRTISETIVTQGVPVSSLGLNFLARLNGSAEHLRAGTYLATPGLTPVTLLEKMERGDVVQIDLVIVEGWTFRQMRDAVEGAKDVRQTLRGASDEALMQALGSSEHNPEGLFFPDTYRYARGTTDLEIYRRAYREMDKRLSDSWAGRAEDSPLQTRYQALILASLIEKETGRPEDRPLVGAVFVNRLKLGMLLQTDPTVIYGLGHHYDGTIHKHDLTTDGPYNTYTRAGLPPTPIALPSAASLEAALHPAPSKVLYFVSRNNGTSEFSENLEDHARAVSKYQKGGH